MEERNSKYAVEIEAAGKLPEGGELSSTGVEEGGRVFSRSFSWVPRRGMEGSSFTACFSAQASTLNS